jgi:ABC-type Fe3+-hydroxamate transport system substrate-binding protein
MRPVLLATLSLAALAACGDGAAGSSPGTGDDPEADESRTVTDARGEAVEVTDRPERVFATTYRFVVDELLLLDTVPVGYARHPSEELPRWTTERAAELGGEPQAVVSAEGVDLEEVAVLEPDLIVATEGEDDLVPSLERIAPVLVVEYGPDLDGERLSMLADALGRQDVAEDVLAGVEESLEPVPATDDEIALVFGYDDGGARAAVYHGEVEGTGTDVLELAGLRIKRDYPFEVGEYGQTDIAEENFDVLDADRLWNVSPYPGDVARAEGAMRESPVLAGLDVARRDDVRYLSPELSQAILFWTPLATPTLVAGLDEVLASHG